MGDVLLLSRHGEVHRSLEARLQDEGHRVHSFASMIRALEALQRHPIRFVLHVARLGVADELQFIATFRNTRPSLPCAVAAPTFSGREAVRAMRLGILDIFEIPAELHELIALANQLCRRSVEPPASGPRETATLEVLHAASRWARALAPLIDAPRDPRTITDWSSCVFASPGTLRNWCRTAGVPARHSLILARLMRAAQLNHNGRHRPENLLDIVDLRTLRGLLSLAGLAGSDEFPRDVNDLLARQKLIRDHDTMQELFRAIGERRRLRTPHLKASGT